MSRLPKLKLEMPDGNEEVRDIEEVKNFVSNWGMLLIAEGQIVNNYEDLVKLADRNRDKEYLKLTVMPFLDGG